MEIKKHLHITSSLHILKTIVPLHHCGSTQPTGGLTTRLIGAPDLSSFVAHVPGLAQGCSYMVCREGEKKPEASHPWA
ncbi:hypothetical protein GN956_G15602 [Arapaima gigas]